MNQRAVFFIFVSVLAGLNLGTIRRTEDPIRDTQTEGIAYKQKVEEEKEGVKGPLSYSVKYNPKDTFFVDPPYTAEKESLNEGNAAAAAPAALPDWWEEQPVQEAAPLQASSDGEAAPEEELGAPAEVTADENVPAPAAGQEAKSDETWW